MNDNQKHINPPASAGKVTIRISILLVFILSFLDLLGWMFNITLFKSVLSQYTPMKVVTALCFILAATSLVAINYSKNVQWKSKLPKVLGSIVAVIGILTLFVYIKATASGNESSLTDVPFLNLFLGMETRMAILTAINFIIIGISLLLLSTGKLRHGNIVHIIILPALVSGYFVPASYILGVQHLHQFMNTAVALTSGISICALCIIMLFSVPHSWLMKVFTSKYAGGFLARRLIPWLLVLPLVIGWLRIHGERNNIFDSEVGVLLVALTYTLCFLWLLWLNGRDANKTDDRRRKSEEELIDREVKFRNIFEGSNDAIVLLNTATGKYIDCNQVTCTMSGYTKEEICTLKTGGFLAPQRKEELVSNMEILKRTGKLRGETEMITKDGSLIPIDFSASMLTIGDTQYLMSVIRDISAQKKAIDEIKTLSRFPSENPNPVLRLTKEGIVAYCNHASSELMKLWNCGVGCVIPKDIKQVFDEAFKTNLAQTVETKCNEKTYILTISHVQETGYVNIYGSDITQRRKAEEALKDSEQRYSTTLSSIGDAVIATDVKGHITFMNPVAEKLTGWSMNEAISKPSREIFNIVNEKSRAEVGSPVEKVLRQGIIVGLANHTILIRKDGTEVPIDDSGAPIMDKDGKISGVVLVFRDITERKKAEKALRESEQRFRTVAEALPVCISISNINDGTVIYVNDAHNKTFGFEKGELIGCNASDCFYDTKEREVIIEKLNQQGNISNYEVKVKKADGTPFWVSSSISLINFEGQPAMLGASVDITERKLMEDALLENKEQLSAIFNGVSETLLLLDLEGTVIASNNIAIKRLNHGKDITGKNIYDFIPVEFHEQRRKQVSELIKSKKPVQFLDVLGTTFLEMTLYPVFDSHNNVVQFITYASDVTLRKRAEDALRESEQTYKLLVNSIPNTSIMLFDNNMRFKIVGGEENEKNNIDKTLVEGKTLREAYPKEVANLFEPIYQKALSGNGTSFEMAYNDYIYFQQTIPVKDTDGEIIGGMQISTDISERRKAEKALAESEQWLSTTLSSIGDAVIATDIKGLVTFLNPVAEKLTGWSSEEAIHKPVREIFEIVNEFTRKEVENPVDKVLEQGIIVGLANHTILIKKDGSETPIDDSGAPIRDKDGNISGVVLVFRDITERKKTEENRSRLANIVESSVDAIISKDMNGNIIAWNHSAGLIFGYSAAEALGKSISIIIPPGYEKEEMQILDKIKKSERTEHYETKRIRKDKKIIDVSVSVSPVKDFYGNIIGASKILRDITIQKSAGEALKRSEQEWKETFDLIPDMITILDKEHHILRANKAAVEKLGVSNVEIIGLHCFQCMHETNKPPSFCPHEMMLKDGKEHTTDYFEKRLGMDIFVSVTPVYDSKGRISGSIHIARDITELKKKEKELNKYNRTLNALSRSSQEMTRAQEEIPFLNEVCNIIINYCGYKMVWVGYAEDNMAKTVRPVAYSGFEEGYLEKLNVSWADDERGNGPTGTTIKTGEMTICKNMLTDPAFEPWRKDAIERGYASSIVFPLIGGSKTFGAITIYSRETDSFTEEEIDLLSELADDLSYGIVSIRSRIAQQEAEEALRRSEKNYHRLFEYAAIPIWKEDYSEIKKHIDELKAAGVTDFRTYFKSHMDEVNHLASHIQVLDINQKSVEMFNAESKDDVIRSMLFYFNEESLEVFKEELIVLAEGGKQFECEMPIRTLTGDIKIIDLHLSVVKGFENTLSNVLVSYIDITDRKRMDNELKEKNAALVDTNATKDKFFKIIAHDMKNPFISLLGASELLYENAQKYDSAKITKLSRILNDSAKSGYDMLLNLLEWSRSQAGSMIFQPEKVNLKELINKNHGNLIENACGKKINLSFDIENDLHVYADKNMLDTIIRNLITNALKFTKKGGAVTVSTKRENGSIIVLVKDTGVGIKEEDFDKLFRTDIKYSQPGTEHEGGTGLGLLLCKEFVEKHGGKIWVESETNKGTTFYFSLKHIDN